MGSAIHRISKKHVLVGADKFRFPVADWILNPVGLRELIALDPLRHHWEINGDIVSRLDQAGRDQADTDLQDLIDANDRDQKKSAVDNDRLFKAFAIIVMNQFNVLRDLHGLPDLTIEQLKVAIKNRIDVE